VRRGQRGGDGGRDFAWGVDLAESVCEAGCAVCLGIFGEVRSARWTWGVVGVDF
jgi:hypothetical protein